MNISGLHLTAIGLHDVLLEPLKSLNISQHDPLLTNIAAYLLKNNTRNLYYDLSDQLLIDPVYYAWLDALARTTQTLNIQMICVNMPPTAAFTLAQFLKKKPVFHTALSIQNWREQKFI